MNTSTEREKIAAKLLLGAAMLVACAGQSNAQSADDALISKLVSKGILTEQEAQDLRTEASKDFTTAVHSSMNMPDWITGYKLSGDFRGRYENMSSDNNAFVDRTRLRYRLRVGLTISMLDNLEAGFRLISGDPVGGYGTGSPLSGNSTFQDNFSKKSIYLDTAYGKWSPLKTDTWLLSATIGKMDNPFTFTPMVFDPDLTPEGAVVQTGWKINDKQSLSLNGGAFVMDEEAGSTQDPFMYGGQILWNAKWTKKLATTIGLGDLQLVHESQLTTANVPYINRGNTREPITPITPPGAVTYYQLKYNYTPIIVDASATYTLDSFPLYTGKFPIKLTGEFIRNLVAPKNQQGFWTGITLGQSGRKNTWDITYRYEYLGPDAWYDQLVDDDNAAFYPGDNLAGNSSYGYYGGTNIKGHMIKFNYSFTDSLTFTVTCYINSLINLTGLTPDFNVPDSKTSTSLHLMADMMWKF